MSWSRCPAIISRSSSVRRPHFSLATPFSCFQLPATWSQFISTSIVVAAERLDQRCQSDTAETLRLALQFLTLQRVSRCSTPSPPSWPYRSARGSVLVSRERGTRTPLRVLTVAPTPPAPSTRRAFFDIVRTTPDHLMHPVVIG